MILKDIYEGVFKKTKIHWNEKPEYEPNTEVIVIRKSDLENIIKGGLDEEQISHRLTDMAVLTEDEIDAFPDEVILTINDEELKYFFERDLWVRRNGIYVIARYEQANHLLEKEIKRYQNENSKRN